MSEVIEALQKANEPKKRAIVNHTGSCDGVHYQMGVETDLPLSVIAALGDQVKVIGDVEVQPAVPVQSEQTQEEKKEEQPEEQPADKGMDAAPIDKMIGSEDAENK